MVIAATRDSQDQPNHVFVLFGGRAYTFTVQGREYRYNPQVVPTVYRRVAPGLYQDAAGHILPYPEDDEVPVFHPADDDPGHLTNCGPTRPRPSGPYRRMLARPGSGPVWNSPTRRVGIMARVRLPEDTWVVSDDHRGVPYTMLGGWGAGGASPVDAGFMFNTGQRNWSLYMKAAGEIIPSPTQRFPPGADLGLVFRVVGDDQVALSSGGLVMTARARGWRSDGLGNQFKRTTSIAQTEGRENLHSGARVENVRWYDIFLRSLVHAQSWSRQDTAQNCRYPDDDRVRVSPDGWDREWVTTTLPEPAPAPPPIRR